MSFEPGQADASDAPKPAGTDERRSPAEPGTASPRIGGGRRPESKEIPREAKISFTLGISIIFLIILIPVVGYFLRTDPTPPAAPVTAPPPAPAAPSGPAYEGTAKPRTAPTGPSSGGGGGGSAGTPSGDPNVEPPMPVPALTVLKGLFGMLDQASHLPPGTRAGDIDPEQDCLPQGALDGSPAEVLANLQAAQIRVSKQPALALRVVREEKTTLAYKFDLEIVSANKDGDEMVSRGSIIMVPATQDTMRVIKVEAFESFDSTGHKVGPSTFEQGRAAREAAPAVATADSGPLPPRGAVPAAVPVLSLPEGPAYVATYPYIIH